MAGSDGSWPNFGGEQGSAGKAMAPGKAMGPGGAAAGARVDGDALLYISAGTVLEYILSLHLCKL